MFGGDSPHSPHGGSGASSELTERRVAATGAPEGAAPAEPVDAMEAADTAGCSNVAVDEMRCRENTEGAARRTARVVARENRAIDAASCAQSTAVAQNVTNSTRCSHSICLLKYSNDGVGG